jgi:hypothetical protein
MDLVGAEKQKGLNQNYAGVFFIHLFAAMSAIPNIVKSKEEKQASVIFMIIFRNALEESVGDVDFKRR